MADDDTMEFLTPPELKEIADEARVEVLRKSKDRYEHCYAVFQKWQKENNTSKFTENILLAYFHQSSKKFAPTTLWCTYSMLKAKI